MKTLLNQVVAAKKKLNDHIAWMETKPVNSPEDYAELSRLQSEVDYRERRANKVAHKATPPKRKRKALARRHEGY